jgi:hypothetical protein
MRDLLYHFTSGENLRKILEEDQIRGNTIHDGLYGVSLTRDRNLNLMKSYAISGQKPYRLGLDRAKLAQRCRIIPYRDEYLRERHKAVRYKCPTLSRINYCDVWTDTNESEEFLIGDMRPLLGYLVEIAVDSLNIIDDMEVENGNGNSQAYWDIMKGTFNREYDMADSDWKNPVRLPKSVRFVEIDSERPHYSTDYVVERPQPKVRRAA